MSILRNRALKDGYRIQVVDGDDIIKTYLDNKLVKSCMGKAAIKNRLKFYTFCEGLKLLRIVKDDHVRLRSLLWTATFGKNNKKIKVLDNTYYTAETRNMFTCDYTARGHFVAEWKKYADAIVSNFSFHKSRLCVKIKKNKLTTYPYMDHFCYLNNERTQLSTKLPREGGLILRQTDGYPRPAYYDIWL